MQRWILTTLTTIGLLAAGSQAAAQQNPGEYGLGVGVSTFSIADVEALLMPRIYMPIIAGERVMVEPSLGFVRVSDGDVSDSVLELGTGILFLLEPTEGGRMYVGPRIGIVRMSDPGGSETNLTLAGVIGGEYFLRSHFSLGGEVGLRWIDLATGNLISTRTELRARWYFP